MSLTVRVNRHLGICAQGSEVGEGVKEAWHAGKIRRTGEKRKGRAGRPLLVSRWGQFLRLMSTSMGEYCEVEIFVSPETVAETSRPYSSISYRLMAIEHMAIVLMMAITGQKYFAILFIAITPS